MKYARQAFLDKFRIDEDKLFLVDGEPCKFTGQNILYLNYHRPLLFPLDYLFDKEVITLSTAERELVKSLIKEGWRYLAVGDSGSAMYAYKEKPIKHKNYWSCAQGDRNGTDKNDWLIIPTTFFRNFVYWTDAEPFELSRLEPIL